MISLYDLLEASNGQLFGEPAAHIFTDFCLDSRLAAEGQLYVALKTDRGDTHQYMREAVDGGVIGILCTNPPAFDTQGLSVIIVKDTEAALVAWTRYVLNKTGIQVIAVAGTSGKSVTVQAVSRVLATRYQVCSSAGLHAGRLSLPLSLAHLSSEHDFVVLELSPNYPGEMLEMVQTIQPDVGIITTIGHAHTDMFASLDEIARETRILVEHLPAGGLAVLNDDDELVRQMAGLTSARVTTIGIERFGADMMAYNIVAGLTKTGFDLRYKNERYVGRWTPLLGKHQLYAVLAGLAVGLYYDAPMDDALKALTEMEALPGRMRPHIGINDCLVIDDTFTATPQSALAALNWIQAVNGERPADERHRVVLVLGDMDNLGSYSQYGHRSVGQRAAEVADLIITEGSDAAHAGRAALDKGMERRRVCMTYGIQDAVVALKEQFTPSQNDIIIVTGGASARMEQIVRALMREAQERAGLPRQQTTQEMLALAQPTRPSWIEVDLDALGGNVRALKTFIGDTVALMAVVKADAYGHGAVSVSRTALFNGAEYLAVASMNEAMELRDAGIDAPILVMSYTPIHLVRQAVRQRITLTLYDLNLARMYNRAAREIGGKLYVHVKVDTGMGRLGVLASETLPFFRHLINLDNLEIEGIYTHFSSADSDPDYTAGQVRIFKDLLRPLRASDFNFAYIHAANSAGTLASPDNHFNMVRVGLAMYGLSPAEKLSLPAGIRPVLSWKTVVAQVKTLPSGHPVGYGNTYLTHGEERVAMLPVGYADGYRRGLSSNAEVLIHGRRAPIIGRVSMEKIVVNVTDIPDVSIGDEVVLIGTQGEETITADDLARRLNTISYEVLTGIQTRR
ncbi:MAG: alanine racemase [Chloroflexi bacterium]|nr:alanine racemase [Chloroflexota bacterium]